MWKIERIYAVNVALDCLRDGVGNGIWPKGVTYGFIAGINERSVEKYYNIIVHEKKRLIKTACEEIEMVIRLIETNMNKFENIIESAGEMDIYALDQACTDIDKTIRYIRKIIIMIPSIVEKKNTIDHEKNEKRPRNNRNGVNQMVYRDEEYSDEEYSDAEY